MVDGTVGLAFDSAIVSIVQCNHDRMFLLHELEDILQNGGRDDGIAPDKFKEVVLLNHLF